MKKFFQSYDLKKHVKLVAGIYALIFLIGNGVLFVNSMKLQEKRKQEKLSCLIPFRAKKCKKASPLDYVRKPSAAVKVFNGVTGACMVLDLCAYPITKKVVSKRFSSSGNA